MNRLQQVKMDMHMGALSSHYGEGLSKLKFEEPITYDKDSILSNSVAKRIGFISRFNITGDEHHVLILEGDHYSRV